MDQIRNTMMQHEALFKEQVQALHKLYHIQRLAMQEKRRRIYSHAHVLTFSSERVVLADDQLNGSILEGKPLRPAYATGQACEEESLALTLRPFLLFKEFKGSGSLWMNGREIEKASTAQKKPKRNFDLEKLPEDFVCEPEIHVGSNNSEVVDLKSILSQSTENTKDNSVLESNLSVIESEFQSLKQMCSETDLKMFTVTSQEFNQNGDQASEGKASKTDVNKYVTNSWNSYNTIEKNTSKEVEWNYLPAVVSSDIIQDLSPTTNGHVEQPTLLRHQDIGFDSKITTDSKSEQLISCSPDGNDMPQNPTISHQTPSILESLQCKPKDNNNFFFQNSLHLGTSSPLRNQNMQLSTSISQTVTDGSNDNPNESSNGSSSLLSQDTMSCKNKNNSAHAEESRGLGNYSCDKGKMGGDGGDIVESESQQSHQFIQDGSKYSFCLNSEPEIMSSLDEAIVNNCNEDVTGTSAQQEESESMAAEILLSFAPCRTLMNSEFHCSETRAESSKSGRDINKNTRVSDVRDAEVGGINASTKWAKSVSRRRTSRRRR